mgnify:CR=1 FL=1
MWRTFARDEATPSQSVSRVCDDARPPGPAQIARIRERIRETGAVCLFREPRKTLYARDEEEPGTVRNISLGSQILSALGLSDLVLLTDSPDTRYVGVDAYGLNITDTRPIQED